MPRRHLLPAFALFAATASATAHPHVFIDAEVGFAVVDEKLSSLRISWTYDEFTTLILFDILELDKDRDGILNDEDLAVVAAGETEWPEGYEGDVYLETGDQPVALGRPENASAEMVGDRITVRFDLPLGEPLDLAGRSAVLRLYDPTYYYAYTTTDLDDPAPGGDPCKATVIPFKPDAATAALQAQLAALSREEVPDQPGVGRLFADRVMLTCE